MIGSQNTNKTFKKRCQRWRANVPELFVGGLASSVTAAHLQGFFAQFGEVEDVRLMTYRDGKSRGFGFVRLASVAAAKAVLSRGELAISGKAVEVKIAMSKEVAQVNGEVELQKKVFLSNLPFKAQECDLVEYFRYFGEVAEARVVRGIRSHRSRGFGFVKFRHACDAQYLLQSSQDHWIGGHIVSCKPAISKITLEELASQKITNHSTEGSSVKEQIQPNLSRQECGNFVFSRNKKIGFAGFKRIVQKAQKLQISEQNAMPTDLDGRQMTC